MKKPILIFVIAAQLIATSACNIIPDSFSSSSKNRSNIERATDEQSNELKTFAQEWKEMRPALMQLIELESDLQYMLSNIDQNEDKLKNTTELQKSREKEEEITEYETMTFSETKDITSDFTEKTEELEKLNKTTLFADATLLEELKNATHELSGDDFANEPEELNMSPDAAPESFQTFSNADKSENESDTVEVAASMPLANYLLDDEQSLEQSKTRDIPIVGPSTNNNSSNLPSNAKLIRQPATNNVKQVDTNKFSGQKQSNEDKFISQNQNKLDKFSQSDYLDSTDPRRIVGPVRNSSIIRGSQRNLKDQSSCKPSNETIGDGYALHLASYSTLESAQEGWVSLSNTYKDELCGLLPITEQVTVNSKQFFSLRAGGFDTKEMANYACAQFASKNQYCRSIPFTGEKLP